MGEFEFQYPQGPLINRDLRESSLENFARTDMKTGWVWFKLPTCTDSQIELQFSLAFFNGALRQITIAHHDESLYGHSWNEWSEEREKLRVKNTAAWLEKRGFLPGSYPWGEIWASYDPKGGFGSAGVRYAET